MGMWRASSHLRPPSLPRGELVCAARYTGIAVTDLLCGQENQKSKPKCTETD